MTMREISEFIDSMVERVSGFKEDPKADTLELSQDQADAIERARKRRFG